MTDQTGSLPRGTPNQVVLKAVKNRSPEKQQMDQGTTPSQFISLCQASLLLGISLMIGLSLAVNNTIHILRVQAALTSIPPELAQNIRTIGLRLAAINTLIPAAALILILGTLIFAYSWGKVSSHPRLNNHLVGAHRPILCGIGSYLCGSVVTFLVLTTGEPQLARYSCIIGLLLTAVMFAAALHYVRDSQMTVKEGPASKNQR
jgi:hypothetical protein